MATPKVLILRAPGTNCEVETAFAFELAGAKTTLLHVNRLIESPQLAHDHQILCFPGGFSYGDDIAAGRILAQQLKVHLADIVQQFRAADRLVLGICNGFQIMMRSGHLLRCSRESTRHVDPQSSSKIRGPLGAFGNDAQQLCFSEGRGANVSADGACRRPIGSAQR